MEVLLFEPPETARSALLPMEEAIIVPVGDVQYGSPQCDFDRFARHIAWAASLPNAYFISMGDLLDFSSPSNRARLRASLAEGSLYDTVELTLDAAAEAQIDELMEVLEPTKGRWLGMLEGHHYWEFADGTTSDQRIAQRLRAPFLGTSAMIHVRFYRRDAVIEKHRSVPSFTIWAHHGHSTGAARLQSAPLNTLEHVIKAFDADVYLVGHYHKKAATKIPRITARFPRRGGRGKLVHRNLILACTGSFLKAYEQGPDPRRTSYAEKRMMTPTALGGIVIYARPRWDNDDRYATVDLDVSL